MLLRMQVITKPTPETSTSFTDVDMGAFAAGYAVHKIFRHGGKMILGGEGAFRTSYLGERIDVLAGVTLRALTCTWPRLLSRVVGGVYQCVS